MPKPEPNPGRFDDMHGVVNDAYSRWDEGRASDEETHEAMADVALAFFGGTEALVDIVAEALCEARLQADTGMLTADEMAEVVERLEKRLKGC